MSPPLFIFSRPFLHWKNAMKARFWLLLSFLLLPLSLQVVAQSNVEADILGRIDNNTPFQEYPLRVPITGSTVYVDMRPLEGDAGGDLDTLLYLVDENGSIVAENDDRLKDVDTSSLLVYPQAVAGQYRIIATRFKVEKGSSSGDFRILINIEQPQRSEDYRARLGDLLNTGFPIDFTPRPKADWTLLVYYGGDNNLEPGILQDFHEFELGGGSTDEVRVIALVDRTPEYSVADGNWINTRVYEVGAAVSDDGQLLLADSENFFLSSDLLVDFDSLNTSDGELLAQFLVWGVSNFPADNYIVAFGSHGAGWGGIITDDRAAAEFKDDPSKSILTLPELDKAFSLATRVAGVQKFALLINDACSMGSVEYFATIAPYFEYTIASPEIVVNPAHDMTLLLKGLKADTRNVDLEGLSKQLITRYMQEDVPKRGTTDTVFMTSALIELNQFNPVISAIENFASVVNSNPNVRGLVLGDARKNVYVYTSFSSDGNKIVDLGDLMRRVIASARDDEMIVAAENVLKALGDAFVYGESGERAARFTSYYNIYFPEKSADFRFVYFDETPLKEWSRMLRNYYNSFTPKIWTGGTGTITFHTPVAPTVRVIGSSTGEMSIMNPPRISLEIIGRNISDGKTTFDRVLEDGTTVRVGLTPILAPITVDGVVERVNLWQEGVERSSLTWDAALTFVSDGVNSDVELVNLTESVSFLDGRYREPNSETWNEVSVTFDLAGRNGGISRVQRVINRGQDNNALAVVEIPAGSEFQTNRYLVNADGRVTAEIGNTYIWQADGGLTWQLQPAPSGIYNMGLLVSAFGGSVGNASAQIIINNDGLNPNLRAYREPDLDFLAPLPTSWGSVAFDYDLDVYRGSKPDQSENLTIYYEFSATTLEEVPQSLADRYGITLTSEPIPVSVSGTEGLEVTYEYLRGETKFIGKLFAIQYSGLGLGFGVEALEGISTNEYYETVKELLVLNASSTEPQVLSNWRLVETDNISFRIPTDWQEESVDGWTLYQPSPDSTALIGTRVIELTSTIQGVDTVINNIVTGFVTGNAESIVVTGNQIYYLQAPDVIEPAPYDLDWRATLYEGVRNGVEVVGRVYATQQNNKTYAIWVEAPKGEIATGLFPNTFEPMVESYRIYPVTE